MNEEINRVSTAPPAKLEFSRRVPDFGIFSLDLDTVTLGRFSRIFFGLWTVLRMDVGFYLGFSGFGFGYSFWILDYYASKIIVSFLIEKSKTTRFSTAFFPGFIVKSAG